MNAKPPLRCPCFPAVRKACQLLFRKADSEDAEKEEHSNKKFSEIKANDRNGAQVTKLKSEEGWKNKHLEKSQNEKPLKPPPNTKTERSDKNKLPVKEKPEKEKLIERLPDNNTKNLDNPTKCTKETCIYRKPCFCKQPEGESAVKSNGTKPANKTPQQTTKNVSTSYNRTDTKGNMVASNKTSKDSSSREGPNKYKEQKSSVVIKNLNYTEDDNISKSSQIKGPVKSSHRGVTIKPDVDKKLDEKASSKKKLENDSDHTKKIIKTEKENKPAFNK